LNEKSLQRPILQIEFFKKVPKNDSKFGKEMFFPPSSSEFWASATFLSGKRRKKEEEVEKIIFRNKKVLF
jgi:hypothetical protein